MARFPCGSAHHYRRLRSALSRALPLDGIDYLLRLGPHCLVEVGGWSGGLDVHRLVFHVQDDGVVLVSLIVNEATAVGVLEGIHAVRPTHAVAALRHVSDKVGLLAFDPSHRDLLESFALEVGMILKPPDQVLWPLH